MDLHFGDMGTLLLVVYLVGLPLQVAFFVHDFLEVLQGTASVGMTLGRLNFVPETNADVLGLACDPV